MRVRYLDSRAVITFSEAMIDAASHAREIDFATAFLTAAGAAQVCELAASLPKTKSKTQLRVLVGTWMHVTEPSALRTLRKQPTIQLRIARAPGFHVKHAVFRGARKLVTFTGSANLTAKGLGGEGELVAEVTDDLGSLTDTGERDMFRRLWGDTYPDTLTDDVIDEYARGWKPPKFLKRDALKAGTKLLKKFGKAAGKTAKPRDDGSTLWLPLTSTMSEETVEAVRARSGHAKGHVIGLSTKQTFERVQAGARRAWLLDLTAAASDRSLTFHDIIEEVELQTDDGLYFAIMSPSRTSISLTAANRQSLKDMGLVKRIDSLRSDERTLRGGAKTKATQLLALAKTKRR